MSTTTIRRRRPKGDPSMSREVRARVSQPQHDKLQSMADALGVTAAALIDRMLAREEVDENGRPLWWREMVADQQELPLKTA